MIYLIQWQLFTSQILDIMDCKKYLTQSVYILDVGDCVFENDGTFRIKRKYGNRKRKVYKFDTK